jgi:hypothetical protein
MIVYPSMLWMLALAGSLMAAREDGPTIVRRPGATS